MNRLELTVKAKALDGEWRNGHYLPPYKGGREEHVLYDPNKNKVCTIDPSTVCMCTGLKDKNNKLIYENDIVLLNGQEYIIKWKKYMFELEGFYSSNYDCPCDYFSESDSKELEVIENKFDVEEE